jgi:surface polysaccharide O-acyltransferase-like enzyme
LFLIWLAWSLLYLVPYKFTAIFELGYLGPLKEAYWDLSSWVSSWEKLFFVGSKHHLWFFPSLIIAALITGLFSGLKRYGALYLCAAALYVIGVLAGSYSDTPIGLEIGIHTRHGPFFGTFCFVSGVFLARLQRQRGVFSLGSGGLLLSAGLILSTLEVYVLEDLYGSSLMQDYTFATPLFGLGVFLLALSPAVSRQNYRLADYGIYTLGIYLIHPAIVDLMSPLDKLFFNPVWHLVYPVAAFIVSLLAARVFSEWRYMRSIAK